MTPEQLDRLRSLCRDESAFQQLQHEIEQLLAAERQTTATAKQQPVQDSVGAVTLRERSIIQLASELGQSIVAQIRQPFDLNVILTVTAQGMRTILQADRVAVYRFNPDWSGDFVTEAVTPAWVKLVGPDIQPRWADTYLQETQGGRYRNLESFAVDNIYTVGHSQCHIELLEQFQAQAYAIAPIMMGQTLWGLLAVYQNASPRTWDPTEVSLLTQMGTLVGIVLQQAELFIDLHNEIEERRQVEQSLRQRKAELRQLNTRLEASNRELESFSYSVSHDLRAPLRSIDGFSQALMEDYYDQLDTTAKDFLTRIRTATQRMGKLIDDLLALSRLTRQEMKHEPVDLSAMARAIANELQQNHPDRHVAITIQDGLYASGDSHLLSLVVKNLLDNAWKFTSKQAQARIEFGATLQPDEKLIYFVRDDGAGFDMTYADKLFGAFQRLHNLREFPGTGVGLATVQRIIHRHGGRIWAEAAVNQGATFYFTL
jgi:light-regulated signal transduction histidine kinase (bacteriophytochrome)